MKKRPWQERHPDMPYCDLQADCPDRCKNAPDRCKCWKSLPGGQRRAKPHTLYDSRQIVALYHEGRTYDQIAEEVGCGRSTVTLILRKAGELSRKGRGPIIDYDMVRTVLTFSAASALTVRVISRVLWM